MNEDSTRDLRGPAQPVSAGEEALPSTPPGSKRADSSAASSPARAVDADTRLLARLGRFRIEGLLGAGGMGKVFRAFDEKLGRRVAVKLLTHPNPQSNLRFLAEARAQARVDHPNVCQIYEVAEIEGRPFIVMQFLEGRSLSDLFRELPLEEKVRILADVCEGVHAAHRIGLVHRDLKPSNILVVAGDSGWHPYVVDFGIARDVAEAGLTVTGAILGTPAFMAPEQVMGETVDRRTDVYALGVTLYQLLSGRLPIQGESSIDVLRRVLAEDPRPIRAVLPSVPRDLETIVTKCLERDPARRYDSAKSVALELARYLDGEPIEARPPSRLYRIGKRMRKNRVAVAAGVVAALALLAAGIWALLERRATAERSRLAVTLGAEAEQLEWTLRAAYELPIHDTSPERQGIRVRLVQLEGQLLGTPASIAGPVELAVGRGFLALGELDRALAYLSRAWNEGYQAPEVAIANGLALARQYERAIDRTRRIADPAERKAALAEASDRFGRTAAKFLVSGAIGPTAANNYACALLGFVEGRLDDSYASAERAFAHEQWRYEAKLLQAEIDRRRADAAPPDIKPLLIARAATAAATAARIGESDPGTYTSQCRLAFDQMSEAIAGKEEGIAPLFRSAEEACANALSADPSSPAALVERANGRTDFAAYELDRGIDPKPHLIAAEADAGRVLAADPRDPEALAAVTRIREVDARRLRSSGRDPRASTERSATPGGTPAARANRSRSRPG